MTSVVPRGKIPKQDAVRWPDSPYDFDRFTSPYAGERAYPNGKVLQQVMPMMDKAPRGHASRGREEDDQTDPGAKAVAVPEHSDTCQHSCVGIQLHRGRVCVALEKDLVPIDVKLAKCPPSSTRLIAGAHAGLGGVYRTKGVRMSWIMLRADDIFHGGDQPTLGTIQGQHDALEW